ncbi:mesotocin receptor-like isoform X1 [Sphaerodactylus townsendi]|uniref:mesotocin receptor-like isoform X1 n=1 Tax=Sphaerodactylus townsendi TaxID=933632 RepID=UPI002025D8D3|nr:mesotocin receptor-like isoform X1 [Sphaerodactylus townsendi]XP_048355724.1 mesotocin receptor-like isoform X1 [Sphaerodactylus townsendi]XP_048355725.1 mesotocin receptor-like isoform X1 [Sphaerodactylus townsendi]XP_048355726.1 mesotocin receptor-like isoform X1 [Sphaerodactylus townsendi]XP_048355728.1 mesotocin receptor-like isoform X1 [Sphaerodactylus townsendi]
MKNFSFSIPDVIYQPGTHFRNSTNTTGLPERQPRDEQLAQVEIAVLGVLFMTASIGNFILILVLWKRRMKLSRMYVFLLHLSIADLTVAFFLVLPQLFWKITDVFVGPDILCRTTSYLQLFSMFASTYMIVVMAMDRLQAVCYPMVPFQKKGALWNASICTSWLISLAFSIPQVFIFQKSEVSPGIFDCQADFIEPWGTKLYVTWISVAIFFLPAAILTICHVRICRAVQMNVSLKNYSQFQVTNQKQILPSQASNENCMSNAMIKTIKITVVIVVAYIVCWSPFFIAQLWTAWHPSDARTEGPVIAVLMLLGNLNSCVNPWIYMYFYGQIPHCSKKKVDNIAAHEESTNTGSVNLGEKDTEDNITSV